MPDGLICNKDTNTRKNMALTLFLSSTLRRYMTGYDPSRGVVLEIRPGMSVRELLSQLGIPQREVKVVMVDGIHKDLDYELRGEERLALFPPVGGG